MNGKETKAIWEHIETMNREMGEVQTHIKWIRGNLGNMATKNDIKWIKYGITIFTSVFSGLIVALVFGVI